MMSNLKKVIKSIAMFLKKRLGVLLYVLSFLGAFLSFTGYYIKNYNFLICGMIFTSVFFALYPLLYALHIKNHNKVILITVIFEEMSIVFIMVGLLVKDFV